MIWDRGKGHRPRGPACWWSAEASPPPSPRARGGARSQTPLHVSRAAQGTLRKTDRKMAGKMGGGTEEQAGREGIPEEARALSVVRGSLKSRTAGNLRLPVSEHLSAFLHCPRGPGRT